MIDFIMIGMFSGAGFGFLIGLFLAIATIDGVWPLVWGWLIVGLAIIGAVCGALDYVI